MIRQGILEPVHPGGITNASPVVWQRKKSGELGFCVDLKVHINGKVMDEDYPIQVMKTIFHNLHGASYFTLAKLTSQMPTIKLNLTKRQKIYAQSTHLRDYLRCADYLGIEELVFNLPKLHRISQGCCDHSRRYVGVWNYQGAVRQWECLQSRVDYVRRILLLMRKM